MSRIKITGIIGSGTMGSALAQKFAHEGFTVILVDLEDRFLERGVGLIRNTLKEGVEKRIFTQEKADEILQRIRPTTDFKELKACDIIIEAIFEDLKAKSELFKKISPLVRKDAIVATNTSSFSVSELAEYVDLPERFIGLHYFYHAAKNRLVEVVPGKKTSRDVMENAYSFCVLSGKDPITCKDSYGFVVNRFFVPWLNEAVRLYEEGIAEKGEIDEICKKTFQIGMGPFELMNATGVPIAYHSEKTLEYYGEPYRVSGKLKEQALSNKLWEIEAADSKRLTEDRIKKVNDRMLGMIFFVCSQIIDEKVCSATDMNRGARIGLAWRKGPVEMMKNMGQQKVTELVKAAAGRYSAVMPSINERNWELEYVKLSCKGRTATVTISRPEDMNALNETVMQQLSDKFGEAEADDSVDTIVITGTGKAFVAGADIKFFIDNIKTGTLDKIVSFTSFGQQVYQRIDESKKKVASVINGLALGGGLELALCADIIIATPRALMAFPETGIGIYPGLGGTQRTRKRLGKALTKYMIFTGDMINPRKAVALGLADAVVPEDEALRICSGNIPLPEISRKELSDPEYISIKEYFEKETLSSILSEKEDIPGSDKLMKLRKKIQKKAPVALMIADTLIDRAAGCESELEELKRVFSTQDALNGLKTLGRDVEFQGK